MNTFAIILAAGSGSRMGTKIKKQYLDLNGHSVLWHSLHAFQDSSVDSMILVCAEADLKECLKYRSEFDKLTDVVAGGRERYNSVYSGLCAIESSGSDCAKVLIHDGARPFVSADLIERCIEALDTETGCVAAVPAKDTVKIADADGYTDYTPDRSRVWIVQTPQAFRYDIALDAYRQLISAEEEGSLGDLHVTDDAMVVEHFTDTRVKLVEGSYENIKITTPDDLIIAETIIERRR